ncbi:MULTISPECIES: DUF1476 domain-containing protein [Kordiimonas]|jgi:hypothetical protein|uniref:DUF1476 domain-containing protein n=1 Tax=Kordiimonas lacus TaxID=637679 RepID=A0A1G7CC74_9PROT|nr:MULTISPECIES: DUF1476 domain-containing protein [Kordiimonas]SDE36938.1 hypothetical protein SAMN04488071_2744 [Kordiimonas lacus]
MTTFDSREKAFEDKFAHDETMMFKARARRNRLLGEWLAGEMGLSGDDVAAYAKEVVKSDLEEDGDEDVIRKVLADIEGKGLDISRHRIEKHLEEFLGEAQQQIMAEAK